MSKGEKMTIKKYKKDVKRWDRDKVMDYVLNEIATSARGIETILKESPDDMPIARTFMSWLAESETYQQWYARAREQQASFMSGEIIDICDSAGQPALDEDGNVIMKDGEPLIVADSASIAHARLRVDTRKWLMSKLIPKKWGDRIQTDVEMGGEVKTLVEIAYARSETKRDEDKVIENIGD